MHFYFAFIACKNVRIFIQLLINHFGQFQMKSLNFKENRQGKTSEYFFEKHPENKFQKSTFPIITVAQLFIALLLSRI
jgi:hypothetical protein